MSVLVVQIPPRHRQSGPPLAAGGEAAATETTLQRRWTWIATPDGEAIQGHGNDVSLQLPPAEAVVAVLGETDVAWHRVSLPKAPAAKLRAALLGMLEERLLGEPEDVHLALPADARGGEKCWVATVDKQWLTSELAALERGGVVVDRVVPAISPDAQGRGHFFDASAQGQDPQPAVALADVHGVACLPLAGSLARSLLPAPAVAAVRWTAPPSVLSAAERWLGQPVALRSHSEAMLEAARSTWNFRQFDLVPRRRGGMALSNAWRRFKRPTWRPVRLGLMALVLLQVVALNVWAFVAQRDMDVRRTEQQAVLREAFPRIGVIRDPARQMQRETDLLRAAAGQPAQSDLETMLIAAASAWPEQQGPAQSLRFQSGQLTLAAPNWPPDQARRFAERLQPGGWRAELEDGRVTLTRATDR
jgi:general secretion pathway protein L